MKKICKNCNTEQEIQSGYFCSKCVYQKRKDYLKNYYTDNKDKFKENSKAWCKNNMNKIREKYEIKKGYIYIIVNPAWEGYIKIGRAKNLNDRLLSYQIYSPLRDYEIYYSKYVDNLNKVESYFKDNTDVNCIKYEWYKIDKDLAVKMIEKLTKIRY